VRTWLTIIGQLSGFFCFPKQGTEVWSIGLSLISHSLGTAHKSQSKLPGFPTCSSKMTLSSTLSTFMAALQQELSLPTYITIVDDCAKSSCRLNTDKVSRHKQKPAVCPSRWTDSTITSTAPFKTPVRPSRWESNPGQPSPKVPSRRLSLSLDISLQRTSSNWPPNAIEFRHCRGDVTREQDALQCSTP